MPTNIILGKDDITPLRIDPSRTIFWIGAGVSKELPSGLPLGNKLTDVFLESALGPKWKDFVVLWNNNFPQIRDSVKNGRWYKPEPIGKFTAVDVDNGTAWERPRLEYIIGEIDKLDKYFNAVDFTNPENNRAFHRGSSLHAISNFSIVEPNIYHYRLSDLSCAGAVMITSNFDDGIEKALGVDPNGVETVFGTKAVSNGHGGHIFHFHGIATDDTDNLGATIYSISKGLDEEFQEFLKECFAGGFNIVFIGYSGSDFFDVAPFFRELNLGTYSGKAIYLQHGKDPKGAEDKEEKAYQYLLDPFQNQYIAYGDTDDFFNAIYGSYTPITTSKLDCGAFEAVIRELNKIVSTQVDKNNYYFLNMFRLCSQLNINPGRFYPDWVKRISELYEIWKSDGALERMTVVNGQRNDGIIDDIYSNNWHDQDLTKTGVTRELKPYIRKWEKKHRTAMSFFIKLPLPRATIRRYVDQTIDVLENKKTDEKSVDISRSTVLYLCGMQTKIAIKLYSKGLFKGRMLFLKEQTEKLLQYPFTRFRYRTHYLSLCRQLGHMESVIHKGSRGFEGDIQKEWDICMQTPILYDAGQIIDARIQQADRYGWQRDELEEIRERILDLRRAYSEL